MRKSRTQPQSSVTVRCFRKQKSCCHVIAIPQAGIAAPTLIVAQGFQEKKDCSAHLFSHFEAFRPYSEYFHSTRSDHISHVFRAPFESTRFLTFESQLKKLSCSALLLLAI